jgi:hypothetical protein
VLAQGIADATAGFHSGTWRCGGVAAGGAGTAEGIQIIGWLHSWSPQTTRDFTPAFFRGLSEMGFGEGRNVAVEHRWAEGHADRRAALAGDVVRRQVAVIVVDSTLFARVAKDATQTIPVVFIAGGNPVKFGLVSSFNRPGGNLTGITLLGPDLSAKRLDVLRKMAPAASSIAILAGPADSQYTEAETRDLQSAARILGVRVRVYNVKDKNEIAAAFAALVEQQAGAVLMSWQDCSPVGVCHSRSSRRSMRRRAGAWREGREACPRADRGRGPRLFARVLFVSHYHTRPLDVPRCSELRCPESARP